MNRLLFYFVISAYFMIFGGCYSTKGLQSYKTSNSIKSLRFIGEKVIADNTSFRNTVVGGLSGIEYADGNYFVISDDKRKPVRVYELELDYTSNNISEIRIKDLINIESDEKYIDPESVRYDKNRKHFFWTSEGAIRKGVSPSVFEMDNNGKFVRKYKTPNLFKATNNKNVGPRQNGTFECLSMSVDSNYYWVGMELPLKQDGEEPKLLKTDSPVRISKINKVSGSVEYQFAYYLDPIPKDSKPKGKFRVNGLPEILSVDDNTFIFIERAYASGYSDGGNTVKLYKVDISKADDIKDVDSLKNRKFIPAKKTLLFDFESIRSMLTRGIVDNIEGICFGKVLQNGHKTLVLVSDNNFSMFSPQITQIIVLEIIP